jgi:hypothetical protein
MGSTSSRSVRPYAALARPVLRSGLHVVRRDDAHLQIGLDAPDRRVLPRLPGLLEALTSPPSQPDPSLLPLLDRLVEEGWVVDAAAETEDARARAALRPPVALVTSAVLGEVAARACASAGLRIVDRPSPRAVHLVVSLGEPSRRVSDSLVRDDVTHLFVSVPARAVRLGPFVEPGRTSCLRCVDAHLGERDPRRATVLHQLEQLPPSPSCPWDPALAQIGCAWAARDVVRLLDGQTPSLRAATLTLTDDLDPVRETWLRHPHCGCAWG